MVHVDPNTSYVKQESSSYAKETIYVLYVSYMCVYKGCPKIFLSVHFIESFHDVNAN